MTEYLILGAVQGVAEWLPVSSEGLIFLIKANLYGSFKVDEILRMALFLHLGTVMAAIFYFRGMIFKLVARLPKFGKEGAEEDNIVIFLFVSTLVSGIIGLLIYGFAGSIEADNISAGILTLGVGILLLITAFLQFHSNRSRSEAEKGYEDLGWKDGVILGVAQGMAAFPGLSRSGLTISALLIRKYGRETTLKLSFLMSIPIVIAGNIFFNLDKVVISPHNLMALAASFLFGILTINVLLKVARTVNFAVFVLIFAILTILASFLLF